MQPIRSIKRRMEALRLSLGEARDERTAMAATLFIMFASGTVLGALGIPLSSYLSATERLEEAVACAMIRAAEDGAHGGLRLLGDALDSAARSGGQSAGPGASHGGVPSRAEARRSLKTQQHAHLDRCPHPCGDDDRSVRPGSTCRRPLGVCGSQNSSSNEVPRRCVRSAPCVRAALV